MSTPRQDIMNLLKAGHDPSELVARGYPATTVWRIDKMVRQGQGFTPPGRKPKSESKPRYNPSDTQGKTVAELLDISSITKATAPKTSARLSPPSIEIETDEITDEPDKEQPDTTTIANKGNGGGNGSSTKDKVDKSSGMIVTTFPGAMSLGDMDKVRAALQVTFRPRAISMPTPEMLYPAMVIAITEFGFPLMPPQDFIDTVLYQWLEAAGIIPRVYIKVNELEDLVKKYGYEIFKNQQTEEEEKEVTDGSTGRRTKSISEQDRVEAEGRAIQEQPKDENRGDTSTEGVPSGAAI